MAIHVPLLKRVVAQLRARDWPGVGIELFTVVLGVLLGLQASEWAADRNEREYRDQIIAAVAGALDEFRTHGREIEQGMDARVAEFERARAAGRRPPPPVYREPGSERPPTGAWDAVVATGVARSIEPRLFLRLAMFFNRADNFGERYVRYNEFSEREVLPSLSTPAHFYQGADLRPQYAAYVDRLRDLSAASEDVADVAGLQQRELQATK